MNRVVMLLASALCVLTGCGQDMDGSTYGYGHPQPHGAPPPASDRENFEHYRTNPFVSAEEDDLITFSIDVDTASYTIARRDIMAGRLPDPAAVRVEEFINFFNYRDEAPEQLDDTMKLHSEIAQPFRSQ